MAAGKRNTVHLYPRPLAATQERGYRGVDLLKALALLHTSGTIVILSGLCVGRFLTSFSRRGLWPKTPTPPEVWGLGFGVWGLGFGI